MKKIDYKYATNLKPTTLDDLYNGSANAFITLKEDIKQIVAIEAPITMNTLKQRLRENVLHIGKISANCQSIIDDCVNELKLIQTDNLYDFVLWPSTGIFKVDYIRISERLIYDIPYQELINLAQSINKRGEELYREILHFFGFEVLTKKALEYLQFIEEKAF